MDTDDVLDSGDAWLVHDIALLVGLEDQTSFGNGLYSLALARKEGARMNLFSSDSSSSSSTAQAKPSSSRGEVPDSTDFSVLESQFEEFKRRRLAEESMPAAAWMEKRSAQVKAELEQSSDLILLILNNEFGVTKDVFCALWNACRLRMCADGAANKLFEQFDDPLYKTHFTPETIVGDLDSIRPDVRHFYKTRGSEIVESHDQSTTDAEKALRLVETRQVGRKSRILILGASPTEGRYDHFFANMSQLFKFQNDFDDIVLISQHSATLLLRVGRNEIVNEHAILQKTCGLIPIGGKCLSVTTEGLKWNLENQTLELGGLISSSNELIAERVFVITNRPLLFTCKLDLSKMIKPGHAME